MLANAQTFPSFSVDDLDAARTCYADTLGLRVRDDPMGVLRTELPGGGHLIIYPKADHRPAGFTVLNFGVDDIGAAARALAAAGIEPQRYEQFGDPDRDGVYRVPGGAAPDIAWFTDPAGNVLSLIGPDPAPD